MAESRIVTHPGVIGKYTLPGGKVYSYIRTITTEMEREAKALAPVRTGRLRASLEAGIVWTNQYGTEWRVRAGAPHAQYVVRQTFGAGMPTPLYGGSRRRTGGGRTWSLYAEVPGSWINTVPDRSIYQYARVFGFDGYAANDFMKTAMRAVLLQHGLI